MAGVDECAGAVADVARMCARDTSATSADMIYLRSVSMVQAWNRAGLRIVVLPWLSVMVRVLPRRACFDMVSSSVLGLVSSARCQTCFGSHVMSSMLMVSSFPATFMASIRGSCVWTRCFRCGGMAVPVLSLPALLRPSRVRRLVLVGRGWGRVSCHGSHGMRVSCGPRSTGACGRVRGGFVLVC